MAKLIRLEKDVKTVDGEITVHLKLDINLTVDPSGNIQMSVKQQEPDKEKSIFELPDFEPNETIIDFGKQI